MRSSNGSSQVPYGKAIGKPYRQAPRTINTSSTKATKSVVTDKPEKCKALVLDAGFRPLAVINWHRAIVMDIFRNAEVLEYYDCYVRTVYQDYPIPAVIRADFLMKGIRRSVGIVLNRKNIFKRDRHRCIYCGSKNDLTVDHVVPTSMGGEDTWENMVTACRPCNSFKDNRSLEQLGWTLRSTPKKPKSFDIRIEMNVPRPGPKEWQEYLPTFREEYDLL